MSFFEFGTHTCFFCVFNCFQIIAGMYSCKSLNHSLSPYMLSSYVVCCGQGDAHMGHKNEEDSGLLGQIRAWLATRQHAGTPREETKGYEINFGPFFNLSLSLAPSVVGCQL